MGTHPIFESDFDCLTDKCRSPFMFAQNQYQQNPPQMAPGQQQQQQQQVPGQQQQQPQMAPGQQVPAQPQQMQQATAAAAAAAAAAQQQQQTVHEIDDPIIQIKKMVPKLKESLNSVMTISSKVLEFNCRVDYTGGDQTRPPTVDQNIQTRRDLENAFEEFYHTADLLEAQIKLAQQQCMNTLQAVSTVGPQYVHFIRGMQGTPAGMNNFELGRYNEYIEIVKDQISCATEASEILQSSYRNLRKIDVPGQTQRRQQNTNNQNNRPGSVAPSNPQSPAVSSPGVAGGGGPTTPGAIVAPS